MLTTLREKRLLWPTVMTLVMLPILIGLGVWQLKRKAWKEGLITAIAERTHAAPTSLKNALQQRLDGRSIEYTRTIVRGRFHHDKERHLYAPDQRRGPGVQVVTPFEVAADGAILLVNRGYVPEALKDPAQRAAGQVAGEVEVTGLLREPGIKGSFTPDNDPRANLWFWRDFHGMFASAFENTERPYVPYFLDAEGGAPGGWPKGGATLIDLPNRHLEYAITWFGLACALLAVFAAFAAARLRGE